MIVYIVTRSIDGDGNDIMGVYSTVDKATNRMVELRKEYNRHTDFEVCPTEVDADLLG